MFAFDRLVEGLLFAHAFLLASYVLGVSVLWVPKPAESSAHAMMRATCMCASGLALYGFALFLLAAAGLFSPPFFVLAWAAIVAAGALFRKQSPFSAAFWRPRTRDAVQAWDATSLGVYFTMLLLSALAVMPDPGSDPVLYYLAYAQDWVHAGKLVIDPFLRFPFYATNFTLYSAVLLSAGGHFLTEFLTWMCAYLTAFGICASARVFLQTTVPYRLAALMGVFLTLSVVFAPVFLHWIPSAYVDIPIGTFALFALISVQLALLERDERWLVPFALTGGFLVGMKASFLALLPLLAIVLLACARALDLIRVRTLALFLLLCACSAPWYARNLILAGDPVPPIVNLALHGDDGFMRASEWQSIASDLQTDRTPGALALLPVRAFTHGTEGGGSFRDYGISALIFLIFIPTAVIIVQLILRKCKVLPGISVLLLTGLVAYWFATSTILRYALLFYPSLAVCVAVVGAPFLKNKYAQAAGLLVAFLTMIPSPESIQYLQQLYAFRYKTMPVYFQGDDQFSKSNVPGYREEEYTAAVLAKTHLRGRVYVFATAIFPASFYFRRHHIESIGDWFGPGSYFRMAAAIDARQAPQYLEDLNVVAVEIGRNALGNLGVPLERQLVAAGYCALDIPESETKTRLLVRLPGRCAELR